MHMLYEILGKKGFRKGTDLYFERFDGMAVTVEDFIQALSDANNIDLSQFFSWYEQAGTPYIEWNIIFENNNAILTITQNILDTIDKKEKNLFIFQ